MIDTNTVLAMWWFADPRVGALARAVEGAALRWWSTSPMRDELAQVLQRLAPRGEPDRPARALAAFDRWACLAPVAPPALRLHCSDTADQMFVDLALERSAAWLFSRDRALLKLHRRAAALGLRIVPPDDWQPEVPAR